MGWWQRLRQGMDSTPHSPTLSPARFYENNNVQTLHRDFASRLVSTPASLAADHTDSAGQAGSCLLITNPNNKEQTKLMRVLTHSFQAKGRRVVVWPWDSVKRLPGDT